jgi:hypothetical protein
MHNLLPPTVLHQSGRPNARLAADLDEPPLPPKTAAERAQRQFEYLFKCRAELTRQLLKIDQKIAVLLAGMLPRP